VILLKRGLEPLDSAAADAKHIDLYIPDHLVRIEIADMPAIAEASEEPIVNSHPVL
jgi:hypothetical protein